MDWVDNKEIATAFIGENKETQKGKGRWNNEIKTVLFRT